MHTNNKNKILILAIFASVLFLMTALSIFDISKNTFFIRDLNYEKTRAMLFESGLLYILLLAFIGIKNLKIKIYAYSFISLAFLYIHSISTALILVILYVASLTAAGEIFLLPYRRKMNITYNDGIIRYAHSFMLGSVIYIVAVCALSILQLASMKLILIFTACFSSVSLLLYLYFYIAKLLPVYFYEYKEEEKGSGRLKSFFFVNILFALLFQASRLNISTDYDSLRYALRSPYILNYTKGIYENLGLVNSVYNYPKGLEILTLPLNIFGSYSFIQAFSFVMLVAVLFAVYAVLKLKGSSYTALLGVNILCFVPSLMNMGISAKTDIITLFFQLIAILSFMIYIENPNSPMFGSYLLTAVLALILSLNFKPTSIIFSGLLFISILIFCFIRRKKDYGIFLKKENIGLLIISFICLVSVNLRTYFLTGHPYASIFSTIWERLGMHIKYPYKIESIPNNTYNISFEQSLSVFFKRAYGLFVAPVTEDLLHVYIAFAGVIILVMFVFSLLFYLKNMGRVRDEAFNYLNILNIFVFVMGLYTLVKLYQVDGNYYILSYTLILIVFIFNFSEVLEYKKKAAVLIFTLSCFTSFLFMSVTNWAGVLGNTPVNFRNPGFYEHGLQNYEDFEASGDKEIYDFLKNEKGCRLVSIAYEPRALMFPVSTQSYTDITGSGGNVVLVKYLDNFKEFLDYAETDYVYVEKDYLDTHERASDIVAYMMEDGSLELIIDAERTFLFRYAR